MKKRNILIVTLVLVALVVTGFTFAYWASGITGNNKNAQGKITIGTGESVTTTVSVDDVIKTGDTLVPVGHEGTNKVSSVEFKFTINWDGTGASGAAGTLAITPGAITIDSSSTHAGLFTVTIKDGDSQSIIAGTPKEITITVEFTTEPDTKGIYDLVANKELVLPITFEVTVSS